MAPMTPIMPAPHWGETGSISSRVVAFRSARRHTTSTAMVTTTVAAQAGAIPAANEPPLTLPPWRTNRLVRFEPGSRRDAELDMNTAP